MGLLDDVKSTVTDSLKDDVNDVTLIRESGTYNVASGTVNTTELTFDAKGFSQSISDEYMELSTADNKEREIVIFQSTLTNSNGDEIEPKTADEVKINDTRFDAVAIASGPSQTVWTVVGRA